MSLREYVGFLRRAWRMFRSAKKIWRLPPRAPLLIIDRNTAYPLDEMFAHHAPHVLDIRGESVNLAVVLRAIPKLHLGALAYLEAYIDAVQPTLILSRTDNNPMLWQLKRRPSATYTVALVQNGWRTAHPRSSAPSAVRTEVGEVTYLSFGPSTMGQLPPSLRRSVHIVGSTRANCFAGSSRRHERHELITLISTYRSKEPELHRSQEQIYRALGGVAASHHLKVRILLNSAQGHQDHEQECHFFRNVLNDVRLELRPRTGRRGAYDGLYGSAVTVSGHSSLGYEALALGFRTALVLPTAAIFDGRDWCAVGVPRNGPFWARTDDEAEIERILDYLLTVSDEQWERDSGWIRDQLIVHDYGNTKLKRYVEGVLAGKGDVLAEEEAAASRDHPHAPGRGPTREGAREAGHPDRGGEGRGPRG